MNGPRILPRVGEPAPEIDAPITGDGRFLLSANRGKWVVVYFYPRANTPGWTHEANDFQQHRDELESLNALVVGVSADRPKTQMKFIERFGLTFPMVADADKTVIDAYGAREVLGVMAKRRTFLIAPDGVVAFVWPAVKVEGHADEVATKVREMGAA